MRWALWELAFCFYQPAIDGERVNAIPAPVDIPDDNADVTTVACGASHTIALTAKGDVW
jgi:alpha-tubulin suppressor-like RCC1 family protein